MFAKRFSTCVVFLCLCAAAAFGQSSFTGTVLGSVTDPAGALVVGASVVVTNTATNESVSVKSGENGFYFVPNLRPGTYKVEVESPGFRRSVQEGIPLQIDQRVRVDVKLVLGATTEVVQVTESAPVIQAEMGSLGQVIDNTKIVSLPLNGRGAFNLIGLAPGVAEGSSGSTSGASARINGGRNRMNEIQLDGVTAVNVKDGNVSYTPMVDALQEFKVVTNSFSAEYGRSGGGVILATIKSGTNAIHGTVFEFLRNDVLNARNFFARPQDAKPMLRQNQFGFAVGGPIRRNRTFFFADWQGTSVRTASVRTSVVPTEPLRNGDLRGFNPIYDPATTRIEGGQVLRDAFVGNQIPKSRFDPASAKILTYYPLPNGPGLARNYTVAGPGKNGANQGDIRVDHNLGDKVRLMGRYSINDSNNTPTPTWDGPGNPSNYPTLGRQQNAVASYLHTITPTVVNELRAGLNRVYRQNSAPTFGQEWPRQLGIPNVPQDVFPRIEITGFAAVGTDSSRPNLVRTTGFQLLNNTTLVRGRHFIKFGFDFRRSFMNAWAPNHPSGRFSFGPLQTGISTNSRSGDAWASYLLGAGSGLQLLPGLSSYLSFPVYDFYAQDDIKLTPKLTLNLGLRYEPAFHYVEKYNRLTNFNPETRTLDFAGQNGAPRHFYENDWNNFGPRFGLAYNLMPRTVVRMGYGIYFASAPVASNPGTPLEAPFPYSRSVALPPTVYPNQVLYTLSAFPVTPDDFDRTGRTAGANVYFDKESRAPYMQSWNLSVQRELRSGMALEAAYAGTKGTHLYSPGGELNQIRPELLGPPEKFGGLTPQQRRPYPEFQNIAYNSFGVSSIYHSLQVKAEQRYRSGLSYLLSYTWSKALDNGSGLFGGDNPDISTSFRLQNLYNMRGERALAADDQAHRLVLSYNYELPWMRSGNRLVRLAGAWQLGGIVLMRSGLPFGLDSTSNTSNSLGGRQRANRIKDGNLGRSERSIDRWFDTTAFVNPPTYTFGNSARNVLRAPGRVNFDLMAAKSFPFNDRYRLDFRAEGFNLMNTPPFGFPGATVGTAQMGVIASADAARVFQLALKFAF